MMKGSTKRVLFSRVGMSQTCGEEGKKNVPGERRGMVHAGYHIASSPRKSMTLRASLVETKKTRTEKVEFNAPKT
jgi:hypothetical protein